MQQWKEMTNPLHNFGNRTVHALASLSFVIQENLIHYYPKKQALVYVHHSP